MAIAIFTDDPGWHGRQLQAAFAHLGYASQTASLTECRLQLGLDPPVAIAGFTGLPEAVFVRGIPGGSLEEVVFYLDILHWLKALGIPVYNDGRAIERSVDKAMTSFLLQQAGLATPATWVLCNHEQAVAIAEQELADGHFLISKPVFGSQGAGIRRIEKTSDLLWLTGSRGVYYLQRFVHCRGESYCDHRVFVINGQAVAAMRRHGRFWLNNVAQGAHCEAVGLEAGLADLAVSATKALHMDYAGVDIMEERTGPLTVIEVNSIPAWKGLQGVCHLPIARLLAADLVERYLLKDI